MRQNAVADRLAGFRRSDEAQRLDVKVRVTGDFPGSPVVLDYRIALSDGRIAELRVG